VKKSKSQIATVAEDDPPKDGNQKRSKDSLSGNKLWELIAVDFHILTWIPRPFLSKQRN
jgi:hypothetical protein